jgi:hypothetical protein
MKDCSSVALSVTPTVRHVRVCTDNGHHNGLFAGFSGQKHVKIGPLVEYDVRAHLESGKAARHEPQ